MAAKLAIQYRPLGGIKAERTMVCWTVTPFAKLITKETDHAIWHVRGAHPTEAAR